MHAFPTLSAIIPPELRERILGPMQTPFMKRLAEEHREVQRLAKRFYPIPPVMPGLDIAHNRRVSK